MKTKAERTKRLADLAPGDRIVIDRGGRTAIVQGNEPDEIPGLRARGFFHTRFLMDNGRLGGWTGNGQSMITLATQTEVV